MRSPCSQLRPTTNPSANQRKEIKQFNSIDLFDENLKYAVKTQNMFSSHWNLIKCLPIYNCQDSWLKNNALGVNNRFKSARPPYSSQNTFSTFKFHIQSIYVPQLNRTSHEKKIFLVLHAWPISAEGYRSHLKRHLD